MRYFKYKDINKNINIALKEQYKILTADEKSTALKRKRWVRLSTVVGIALFALLMVGGGYMIMSIPTPNWWLWKLLVIIGKVILFFLLFLVSAISTFISILPLVNKAESFNIPTMKKEIFSKACGHLREYYHLEEPYILTKCFDSSDERFKNHDVCIFVAYDELRITTDLVKGFLHGERDLGCYVITRDEIALSKRQNDKGLILELKADDAFFLLGYRAKGFIDKNFILKTSK